MTASVEWRPVEVPDPPSQAYRSSGTRSKWAVGLIAFTVAGLLYGASILAKGISLMHDSSSSSSDFDAWTTQLQGVDSWYTLGIICSAIAFWAWLTRSITNSPLVGGGKAAFGPVGAVVWWFVPVAFLFQGYRMVADLWRRMAATPAAQGTGIVVLWWLLWIGGTFISRGAGAYQPDTAAEYETLIQVMSGAYVALAASGVVLCRIIWVIEHRAQDRARAMAIPAPAPFPATTAADPATTGFCTGCGTARHAGDRFCARCGRDMGLQPG